ncbi:hypothetical protein AP9108_11075 [Arthrospira sp. PCC 9108]|nr:hypothetical protein AP9108_11075 [Arthrospira sp. PCC 9108]
MKFARRIDEINQLIRWGFVGVADLTDSEKQQAKYVAKQMERSPPTGKERFRPLRIRL